MRRGLQHRPILVNSDYQAYMERSWEYPGYVLITVVYEADLREPPLNWGSPVFNHVWHIMHEEWEEWLENFYPHFDYIPKPKGESGEQQG